LEAIKKLLKRTTAGAAMFLVKVKAYPGEPANEAAKSKCTQPFRAKMFTWTGTIGQIEQYSHGKSLAEKEAR